jgi:hypothetical protein
MSNSTFQETPVQHNTLWARRESSDENESISSFSNGSSVSTERDPDVLSHVSLGPTNFKNPGVGFVKTIASESDGTEERNSIEFANHRSSSFPTLEDREAWDFSGSIRTLSPPVERFLISNASHDSLNPFLENLRLYSILTK